MRLRHRAACHLQLVVFSHLEFLKNFEFWIFSKKELCWRNGGLHFDGFVSSIGLFDGSNSLGWRCAKWVVFCTLKQRVRLRLRLRRDGRVVCVIRRIIRRIKGGFQLRVEAFLTAAAVTVAQREPLPRTDSLELFQFVTHSLAPRYDPFCLLNLNEF